MISFAESPSPAPNGPRPLQGVAIVIAVEAADKSQRPIGLLFAKNTDNLEELLRLLHGQKMTVNLANIRTGVVTLDPIGKEGK